MKVSTFVSTNEASFSSSTPIQPPKLALLERVVNLIDVFVNIYSIVAFAMTSSLMSAIFMDQSRFMNDVAMGLYDFTPKTKSDEIMLYAMKNASFGQSRSLGIRDGAMAFSGGENSSSYVFESITLLVYHIKWFIIMMTFRGDFYIKITVYYHLRVQADDTRFSYDESCLYCTDPSYYTTSFTSTSNKTNFKFRVAYVVSQEYFPGLKYNYVTHLSYCQEDKINDLNLILYILDYAGQIKRRPWLFKLIANLARKFLSQMLVEVLYLQLNLVGQYMDLARAMYAMRHAWVCIGVSTMIRLYVMHLRTPCWLRWVVQQFRLIEKYCSCRILIVAFVLSSFLAIQMRVNVVDDGLGMKKGLLWDSELFQSLAINHSLGLLFGTFLSITMRLLLEWISPNHQANSLFATIDRYLLCSGFDMARLVAGSRSLEVGSRCWSWSASKKDTILHIKKTDLLIPELDEIQAEYRTGKFIYCGNIY
ncbi:hypothetical protein THRCLA_01605 [Thraustotheca clavata]|uniref:Uncharacterized protein n=1 Tax=Thraustotheca clavata TaxID=74557 RepID=A0A1W0A817_9STRA|nr:hypothetical protein THRCLA_01605 [Thraustotheca clavata]